jgi:Lrp/AsnC family leucine-responsive transcriptional regulator
MEEHEMKRNLDAIDEKIIEILQGNARTTIKDIAAQVYLSSPAVIARIERLEERGIVAGYHAKVDPEAFGYRIKAFVNLEIEPSQKQDFYPYISTIPNVIECNCVTGEYAMLMEVAFFSTSDLDQFIDELQKFGKTRTQIVFSTVVEHRNLPIKCPA